jgi:hypothetical protein
MAVLNLDFSQAEIQHFGLNILQYKKMINWLYIDATDMPYKIITVKHD